jgi:hypothetical protein
LLEVSFNKPVQQLPTFQLFDNLHYQTPTTLTPSHNFKTLLEIAKPEISPPLTACPSAKTSCETVLSSRALLENPFSTLKAKKLSASPVSAILFEDEDDLTEPFVDPSAFLSPKSTPVASKSLSKRKQINTEAEKISTRKPNLKKGVPLDTKSKKIQKAKKK